MVRLQSAVAALCLFAATSILAPATALANGDGAVAFFSCESGKVDVVTATSNANGSSSAGPTTVTGSLVLPGIPTGASIRKAFLYYTVFGNKAGNAHATAGSITGPSGTSPLGLTLIGTDFTGTGLTAVQQLWYRDDVTASVSASTSAVTYPFSITANASPVSRTKAVGGAGLVVIYDNPSLTGEYHVEIHDGSDFGATSGADGADFSAAAFSCFTAYTPAEADVIVLVHGGSTSLNEEYRFGITGATTTIATNTATAGFEADRLSVSSFFAGGETTAFLTVREGSGLAGNPLSWGAAILRMRVRPPDQEAPQLMIESPAENQALGSTSVDVTVHVHDTSGVTITSDPAATWSSSPFSAPTDGSSSATFDSLSEGTHQVTVTARDEFDNETSQTVTFRVDVTPPTVAITAPADGTIVGTTGTTIDVTVTDATGTEISLPDAQAAALGAGGGQLVGVAVSLADEGDNILSVSATDEAGNTGGAAVTVVRDTIAPAVTVSPDDGQVFGDSPAILTVNVEDATQTTVTFGSNTEVFPTGNGSVTGDVAISGDGDHTIDVVATDGAGNSTTVSRTIVLDTTAPVVSIDSPANEDIFGVGSETIGVIATVNDITATTLASTATLDASNLPAGGGVVTGTMALTEGDNDISVTATDAAHKSSGASVTVRLDTTPPEVHVSAPAEGATVRGPVDFHAVAEDVLPGSGVASIALEVDGNLVASLNGEASLDTFALADGSHELKAVATDGKGNSATSAPIQITVDNTNPALAITSPSDGAYVAGTIAFTVTASDGGSGLASVDMNGAPAAVAAAQTVMLDTTTSNDGPLTLTAHAQDAAGNESNASVTVTVDNSAPNNLLITPTNGSTVSGILAILAASDDVNLASLEVFVDGVPVGSTSSSSSLSVAFDTTSKLDGTMVVKAVGVDLAGNRGETAATVTIDNLSFRLDPLSLNLGSKGGDNSITVFVEGGNVALLLASGPQLKVPGGSPISLTPRTYVIGDADADLIPDVTLKFDRQALINSIRAGMSAAMISANGSCAVTLTASPNREIGSVTIKIVGR